MLTALYSEFKNSIKSPDTEEKLDLILYRPIGFLIAKIAWMFKLTPSMLSLFGLGFGLLAALYYLNQKDHASIFLGSVYFVLSGIFDSSDGQLARLSNQSTKLGLILDGICDSLVTIAIYLCCSWEFIKIYGWWFVFVVFLGLHFHSCQCAILDFYHREYLFFGYGKTENDTYWNPGLKDAQNLIDNSSSVTERVMNKLRMTWIRKQQWLTLRTEDERERMRSTLLALNGDERSRFMNSYRQHNLSLLPFWRLVGVNAHTALIILFCFLGRFDIYLIVFDLLLLNIAIYVISIYQKKADKIFLSNL